MPGSCRSGGSNRHPPRTGRWECATPRWPRVGQCNPRLVAGPWPSGSAPLHAFWAFVALRPVHFVSTNRPVKKNPALPRAAPSGHGAHRPGKLAAPQLSHDGQSLGRRTRQPPVGRRRPIRASSSLRPMASRGRSVTPVFPRAGSSASPAPTASSSSPAALRQTPSDTASSLLRLTASRGLASTAARASVWQCSLPHAV